MGLLYEDVIIFSKHASFIRKTLEGVGDDEFRQRVRVRRVCLPYSSSVPQMATAYPTDAISILASCPSLEVLVRPMLMRGDPGEAQLFQYLAEPCPPLTSLKRLDWWHRNEAAKTGGINSLVDVLKAAPNLNYLSLEGEVWMYAMQLNTTITLRHLTTLHLRCVNILFVLQLSKWSFPSLRNVILDRFIHDSMPETIGQSFGSHIRTLELGKSLKFYTHDALRPILHACPHLEEVNYYVFFTARFNALQEPYGTLTTIGLHGAHNPIFDGYTDELWTHLEHHLSIWCSSFYPNLAKLVLYGDWRYILNHPRYAVWEQKWKEMRLLVEVHDST